MKTKEEFAQEYVSENYSTAGHTGDDIQKGDISDAIIAGIEFAQRWIPVEEELPEADCFVLTKNKGNDDKDYYRVLWFRNLEFFTTEITSNVTHWRPIELS